VNARRAAQPPPFAKSVFINCPFDREYQTFLRPVLFTVLSLGFAPRIATERSDSAESRIGKICELIRESQFSIHDLSRLKPDGRDFARMNMPFELGIDYGAREFGRPTLRQKRCLILGAKQYDYQKALSDLSGVDIKSHDEDPENAVSAVRDWFFETVGVRPAPTARELWYAFGDFQSALYSASRSRDEIDRMRDAEFIYHVEEWRADRGKRVKAARRTAKPISRSSAGARR
jgi:hypothetical protein